MEPLPMIGHVRRLDAYQKIALAVILQAFSDAANGKAPRAVREEARAFIAGSPGLAAWGQVAGLDAAFVRQVSSRFFRSLIHVVSVGGPGDERREPPHQEHVDRSRELPAKRRVR